MQRSPITGASLLDDKRILLYLFVGFRLMLLLVYQSTTINNVERGLTTFGDFQHYYTLAKLSDLQKLPYRDYWYEFPPVFPILSLGVYSIAGSTFSTYATVLGLVMIAVDTLNLLVVRRVGARLYGEATGQALAWIYALLAVPLVFTFWTFEPLVTASVLLAILWLIEGHENRSALAVAFGTLTKFYPLIILPAVWRFRTWQVALRQTLITLVLTGVGLLSMLVIAGPFGLPSLLAQSNKASYETVWALIDHNYTTGNFGPIADRFDPAKAYALLGNPAVIPAWLRIIIFGGIGLLVYTRTRRSDSQGLLAFVSITITLFFLWSQGWSPQWQMTLGALILLSFPTRGGVLACLGLALFSFIEYPLLFSHTGDTGGAISLAQLPVFTLIVVLRTVLLIGFAVALYQRLRISETENLTSFQIE